MQQLDLIFGFSELKELLIRKYQIERDREFVKLFFSDKNNELLMHDYDDHLKIVTLCFDLKERITPPQLLGAARYLVLESLKKNSPAEFLIKEFQLNGFFKS